MKKNSQIYFLISLALLSIICGLLLAHASLTGKLGITLFYKQYLFLKSWWKTALIIFSIHAILYFILKLFYSKIPAYGPGIIVVIVVIGIIGFILTYLDFHHSFAHRILGSEFHAGAYLFWLLWVGTGLYLYIDSKIQQSHKKLSL